MWAPILSLIPLSNLQVRAGRYIGFVFSTSEIMIGRFEGWTVKKWIEENEDFLEKSFHGVICKRS